MAVHAVIGDELKPHLSQLTGSKVSSAAVLKRVAVGPSSKFSSLSVLRSKFGGFPGGAVVENPPANAGDTGSSPGPGRSHMLRSS